MSTRVELPEHMQRALELLLDSAMKQRGREFDAASVNALALYIRELQKANIQAIAAVESLDIAVMAYVGEYGDAVLLKLIEEEGVVDGEIVEGEVEAGRSDEESRLDASLEEE